MFITVLNILLINITAAKNEVVLSYRRLRGLYSLAVISATTIVEFHRPVLISQTPSVSHEDGFHTAFTTQSFFCNKLWNGLVITIPDGTLFFNQSPTFA